MYQEHVPTNVGAILVEIGVYSMDMPEFDSEEEALSHQTVPTTHVHYRYIPYGGAKTYLSLIILTTVILLFSGGITLIEEEHMISKNSAIQSPVTIVFRPIRAANQEKLDKDTIVSLAQGDEVAETKRGLLGPFRDGGKTIERLSPREVVKGEILTGIQKDTIVSLAQGDEVVETEQYVNSPFHRVSRTTFSIEAKNQDEVLTEAANLTDSDKDRVKKRRLDTPFNSRKTGFSNSKKALQHHYGVPAGIQQDTIVSLAQGDDEIEAKTQLDGQFFGSESISGTIAMVGINEEHGNTQIQQDVVVSLAQGDDGAETARYLSSPFDRRAVGSVENTVNMPSSKEDLLFGVQTDIIVSLAQGDDNLETKRHLNSPFYGGRSIVPHTLSAPEPPYDVMAEVQSEVIVSTAHEDTEVEMKRDHGRPLQGGDGIGSRDPTDRGASNTDMMAHVQKETIVSLAQDDEDETKRFLSSPFRRGHGIGDSNSKTPPVGNRVDKLAVVQNDVIVSVAQGDNDIETVRNLKSPFHVGGKVMESAMMSGASDEHNVQDGGDNNAQRNRLLDGHSHGMGASEKQTLTTANMKKDIGRSELVDANIRIPTHQDRIYVVNSETKSANHEEKRYGAPAGTSVSLVEGDDEIDAKRHIGNSQSGMNRGESVITNSNGRGEKATVVREGKKAIGLDGEEGGEERPHERRIQKSILSSLSTRTEPVHHHEALAEVQTATELASKRHLGDNANVSEEMMVKEAQKTAHGIGEGEMRKRRGKAGVNGPENI